MREQQQIGGVSDPTRMHSRGQPQWYSAIDDQSTMEVDMSFRLTQNWQEGSSFHLPTTMHDYFIVKITLRVQSNKVLRCSPEQLKKLTEDQRAAVTFVTPDLLPPRPQGSKRGAQVFTDISNEMKPPDDEAEPVENMEPPPKRVRVGAETDQDFEQDLAEEFVRTNENQITANVESDPEGSTLPTTGGNSESAGDEAMNPPAAYQGNSGTPEASQGGAVGYGPIRTTPLTQALRRSVDILDHGQHRVARQQMTTYPAAVEHSPEGASDAHASEVFMVIDEKVGERQGIA
eukprot:s3225_g5.t1